MGCRNVLCGNGVAVGDYGIDIGIDFDDGRGFDAGVDDEDDNAGNVENAGIAGVVVAKIGQSHLSGSEWVALGECCGGGK